MAQEEESETVPQAGMGALLARVAEILGIPQDDLAAAFKQARQEMREECQATDNYSPYRQRIKERVAEKKQRWQELKGKALNRARERICLTDEEREEVKEWWEQKPECLEHPRFHIRPAMRGRQMIAVAKGWRGPMPYQPAE